MSELEDDVVHVQDKELGRYNNRKYKDAIKEIARLNRELDAYQVISVPPSKRRIPKPRKKKRESVATVVAMASDWHIDELVRPSTVQGRNKFDPDIAKKRAWKFFTKLVLLTDRNRMDTTIKDLVLVLGGDFISGNIHEELLENTSMRPLEAIMFAQDLIAEGLRYLETYGEFDRIVVICKDGNHGRITQKIRHQSRAQNSLEWAMYHNLAKTFDDMEWIIEDSYLTYYTIYDEVLRIHHGDAIRYAGGVGGLEIPMKRRYYQWNMTEPAHINLMGHYHSYTTGYNTVNGSLIGYNAYAAKFGFEAQPPIQAYILLDADKGITQHSPILVE